MNTLLLLEPSYISANSNVWFGGLIEASVKAAIVLAAAAALGIALRRAPSATRHLLWNLALCSLLVLPVLSLIMPAWQIALPGRLASEPPAVPDTYRVEPSDTFSPGVAANPVDGETIQREVQPWAQPAAHNRSRLATDVEPMLLRIEDQTTAASSALLDPPPIAREQPVVTSGSSINWSALALALWLAGVLVALARLFRGIVSVWRIVWHATPMSDAEWDAHLRELSFLLGLGRKIRLLKSGQITMPMTWGLIEPVVLLPADAPEWPVARRSVVLLHELAHVKRIDCLTQLLTQMTCAVYWFNPLVQLAARHLRIEAERACDDYVLGSGARASDYAEHLLQIARSVKAGRILSPAALSMARPSQLEARMLAILDPGLNRRRVGRITSVLVSLVMGGMVLSVASLRATAAGQAPQASAPAKATSPPQQKTPAAAPRAESGAAAESPAAERSTEPAQAGAQDATLAGGSNPKIAEAVDREEQEQEQEPAERDGPEQEPQAATQKGPAAQGDRGAIIDALANALKDQDVQVRRQAAFALGQLGDSRAAEALAGALRDKDALVRMQAIEALGMRGGSKHVDLLIEALKDENAKVREQAAVALGLTGDSRVVEPLIGALRDQDSRVRAQAAQALGLRGDQRVVEPLIGALKDSDSRVRVQAAQALGLRGDQRVVEPLIAALKDSDAHVRVQAAQGLGLRGDKRVIEPLIAAMKDPDSHVRVQAAQALGLRGDSRVVEPLIAALKDPDPRMRCIAAESLGLRGDHRAVDALKEALKDENSRVRQRAAAALGLILMRTNAAVKVNVDLGIGAGMGVGVGVGVATDRVLNRVSKRIHQIRKDVRMAPQVQNDPEPDPDPDPAPAPRPSARI